MRRMTIRLTRWCRRCTSCAISRSLGITVRELGTGELIYDSTARRGFQYSLSLDAKPTTFGAFR